MRLVHAPLRLWRCSVSNSCSSPLHRIPSHLGEVTLGAFSLLPSSTEEDKPASPCMTFSNFSSIERLQTVDLGVDLVHPHLELSMFFFCYIHALYKRMQSRIAIQWLSPRRSRYRVSLFLTPRCIRPRSVGLPRIIKEYWVLMLNGAHPSGS